MLLVCAATFATTGAATFAATTIASTTAAATTTATTGAGTTIASTTTATTTGWPSGINGRLNNMFLDPEDSGSIPGEKHGKI